MGNKVTQPSAVELLAALVKAQGEFPPIKANRTGERNGQFFHYADLDELIRATRPALVSNGLGVMQPLRAAEGGGQELVTRLIHVSGAVEEAVIKISTTYSDLQEYGAAVTYLRRCAYQAILCISADVDLDNASGARMLPDDDMPPEDAAPQRGSGDMPPYPQDKFDELLPARRQGVINGETTAEDIIAMIESRYSLTEQQRQELLELGSDAE